MAKITKLSEMSKDFGMKAKDVIEGFKAINIDKNSGASVNDEEFELFMQHLTSTHQIHDLEAYTSGKITIKSAEKKKAAPKAEPKPEAKVEQKAEPKPVPKAEQPKRDAAGAQRKSEERGAGARAPQQQRPQQSSQGQQRGSYQDRNQRYGARPSEDPFAKRRENMNRNAEGSKSWHNFRSCRSCME